jgi:hypothetical protein
MPGFLGGSSGSSGTGGEISFPKEFIDPVTKLRVSQPENLIDTDFEYGLQPTKWETVELINNTPSFFSKSGDTTIPNIVAITTNDGTREITVITATDHGLAVGIPINVTGTKSVTADGSYVINSIPNLFTFTYLCKDEQVGNNSIEDLYSSIITGEFFQGSQIRIADAEGVTTDAESISTLTVKTDSTHGFGLNTPFYFLNLNSTISQEFEASNTAAKSFDSSNSATAQTFDGSNTLSTFNIDWSNSATFAGVTSNINAVSTLNDTISVAHGTETFANQPLGTPLYYNLSAPASSGYFSAAQNPRGVVFLKTVDALNSPAGFSTFQVSAVPDGDAIDITSEMSGTFQLANQARTFSGNNVNPLTQTTFTVIKDTPFIFDGGNQGYDSGTVTNGVCSVEGYAATILVSVTPGAGLDYYVGAMVKYESSGGSSPAALVSGDTYFIASFASTVTPNQYRITLKALPDSATALAPTGGTATTQTFTKIGVAADKDIVHVRNANFAEKDMVEYSFPAGEGGRFVTSTNTESKLFYFISKAYDAHNYQLSEALFAPTVATGGTITDIRSRGIVYRTHTFPVGTTNFVVSSVGTNNTVEYLIVAGGGGGGGWGGGGGGGGFLTGSTTLTAQTYSIVVGDGGIRGTSAYTGGGNGGNSSGFGLTAVGGGGGGWYNANNGAAGGSGGGGGSKEPATVGSGANGTVVGGAGTGGQGNAGGATRQYWNNNNTIGWYPGAGGGGGAGGVGGNTTQDSTGAWTNGGVGGAGLSSAITGDLRFYSAGGGGHTPGSSQSDINGDYFFAPGGSFGVGGDGGNYAFSGIGSAKDGQAGRGGGGGGHWGGEPAGRNSIGAGGSGVVVVRYQLEAATAAVAPVATGGTITTTVVGDTTYRIHAFTSTGANTFTVTNAGNLGNAEYLVVGGGGGGASWVGGGGGGGGFLTGTFPLAAQSYTATVGAGGALYTNGGTSSIAGSGLTTISALGGGHGGGWQSGQLGIYSTGSSGSSSGGAGAVGDNVGGSNRDRVLPAAATAGQGYQGGSGVRFTTDNANSHVTGGGGGAGGPGTDGADINNSSQGRANGGQGRASNILGTTYYWGGGGGGSCITTINSGNGGIGGGGGGHSWVASPGQPGASGLNNGTAGQVGSGGTRIAGNGGANTGGGGGGGYTSDGILVGNTDRGGIGGSGFIAIRYPISITGIL